MYGAFLQRQIRSVVYYSCDGDRQQLLRGGGQLSSHVRVGDETYHGNGTCKQSGSFCLHCAVSITDAIFVVTSYRPILNQFYKGFVLLQLKFGANERLIIGNFYRSPNSSLQSDEEFYSLINSICTTFTTEMFLWVILILLT